MTLSSISATCLKANLSSNLQVYKHKYVYISENPILYGVEVDIHTKVCSNECKNEDYTTLSTITGTCLQKINNFSTYSQNKHQLLLPIQNMSLQDFTTQSEDLDSVALPHPAQTRLPPRFTIPRPNIFGAIAYNFC